MSSVKVKFCKYVTKEIPTGMIMLKNASTALNRKPSNPVLIMLRIYITCLIRPCVTLLTMHCPQSSNPITLSFTFCNSARHVVNAERMLSMAFYGNSANGLQPIHCRDKLPKSVLLQLVTIPTV